MSQPDEADVRGQPLGFPCRDIATMDEQGFCKIVGPGLRI